jgi:hypothetical protein
MKTLRLLMIGGPYKKLDGDLEALGKNYEWCC